VKVSIVIRAYNSQHTIKRAIKSALHQNFPKEEFEIIIIDDASTDKTLRLLSKFKNCPQIRILKSKNNIGHVKAANECFKHSAAQYVVLLDTDDKFGENLLKEEVSILDNKQRVNLVYSDYFEKTGTKIVRVHPKNIYESVAVGTMYRRNVLQKTGYFRETLFPEYDLVLRNPTTWKHSYIPKPLFTYIRNSKSITSRKTVVAQGIADLKKHYPNQIDEIQKIRTYD